MQRQSVRAVVSLLIVSAAAISWWGIRSVEGREEGGHRVFEMRTYVAHPGKLEALHARFRDHTMKLFEKHGMKNVIYLNPTDPKAAADTLVYIISHASKEAGEASWKAFREDPEWQNARAESEKDGPLVKSVKAEFFTPTDYSPIQK